VSGWVPSGTADLPPPAKGLSAELASASTLRASQVNEPFPAGQSVGGAPAQQDTTQYRAVGTRTGARRRREPGLPALHPHPGVGSSGTSPQVNRPQLIFPRWPSPRGRQLSTPGPGRLVNLFRSWPFPGPRYGPPSAGRRSTRRSRRRHPIGGRRVAGHPPARCSRSPRASRTAPGA